MPNNLYISYITTEWYLYYYYNIIIIYDKVYDIILLWTLNKLGLGVQSYTSIILYNARSLFKYQKRSFQTYEY